MARTKASVGAKISSGKSSKARCTVAPSSSGGGSGSGDKSSRSNGGGNPMCPRETPKWQKPITTFFITKDTSGSDDGAGSSDQPAKKKRPNVIDSDEDEPTNGNDKNGNDRDGTDGKGNDGNGNDGTENEVDDSENDLSPKVNQILDETIELEDLKGENSHKIEEYYPKGKGKGKKSAKNKENVGNNKRDSLKRDLEDAEERTSKRVKVN